MKTNQSPITELDNLMAVETFQPITWIISRPKRKKPLLAKVKSKSKKQKQK